MGAPMGLEGKVAVIAGGSGGIGAATARRLAQAGARVVIGYNKAQGRAEAIARELPGGPHRSIAMPMEDSVALRAVAGAAKDAYGRCDMLVNSAGFTRPIAHGDLEALDDALIDAIFAANFRGPFAAIRALAPLLRASGDGLVVNISSISGTTGIGSNVAYCASKAALDVMTKSLARALAPAVRVMAVSPGVVDTNFVPGRDAAFNEKIAAGTPLRRVTSPDDVALAVLACATHLRFSTGDIVTVDGGRHL